MADHLVGELLEANKIDSRRLDQISLVGSGDAMGKNLNARL